MAKTLRSKLIYLPIAVLAFFLLSFSLGEVPVHLNQDEMMFGLNAHSISHGLRDYYGNKLPFYFWHLENFWATPVTVYFASLVLSFLPLAESTIRIATVLVGVVSTLLMFALVKEIFGKKPGLLSALLLATTPAFFINSRLLLDNIYPLPFVLLWLLLLRKYLDTRRADYLAGATLSLGLGVHSYHAAKIMMPVYFLATLFLALRDKKGKKKDILFAIFTFLIPILLFIPWLSKHPDTLLSQVSYAGSIDETIRVDEGLSGVFDIERIGTFLSSYPTYFSPRTLFFEGDRTLVHSTGKTGVFLFPTVILLAFGLLEIFYKRKDTFSKLIVFGLLTYPLAPSLVDDPQRVSRGLVVIPFAVLLFVYGAHFLLKTRKKMFRHLLYFVFLLSFIELLFFFNDYFGEYKERSYSKFNYDIGGAVESALRSTEIRNVDEVYLDDDIPFVLLYSDFYQKKLAIDADKKIELFDFSEEEFTTHGPGSLFVIRWDNAPKSREREIDGFERIEVIREPDGNESFYVFYNSK